MVRRSLFFPNGLPGIEHHPARAHFCRGLENGVAVQRLLHLNPPFTTAAHIGQLAVAISQSLMEAVQRGTAKQSDISNCVSIADCDLLYA